MRKSVRSVDKLPMDILDEVNRSSNRRAMKDQIADFLLWPPAFLSLLFLKRYFHILFQIRYEGET